MRTTTRYFLAMAAALAVAGWFGPGAEERAASEQAWTLDATLDRDLPPTPSVAPPDGPGRLVVDLVDGASEADLAAVAALIGADLDWVDPLTRDEALAVGEVADLDDAIALLSGDARIEVAEPELPMAALGFPNDPLYPRQWHLRAMGAPAGWTASPGGAGVVVAVVDTGVAPVEDLDPNRLLPGASFVPTEPDAVDRNGHGTHVAGTIAQTTDNGIGVAGVAPAARILPIKVLSATGNGTSEGVAAGIDHAVDLGADVINLSLGGQYSRVVHTAVRKARARGVLVVAAAGNSGQQGVSWPGALDETIGVSALDADGALAWYSSWGRGVDVAAPGGDTRAEGGGVLQDTIDGSGGQGYRELQGTSMATPHVAGAAAVLLSTGASPDEVERVLVASARGEGWDARTGYGALDLERALAMIGDAGRDGRFALAVVLAWIVTGLSGAGLGFRLVASATAGFAAGGAFFLGAPTLEPTLPWQLATRSLLTWPAALLGTSWVHFPLWLSALIPVTAGLVLGAFRPTRALALGLSVGIGAHLFVGALDGSLTPWWFPTTLGRTWLGANAALSLLIGIALAGTERLDRR